MQPETKTHQTGNVTADGPQVLFAATVDFKSPTDDLGPSRSLCHCRVWNERICSVLMKNRGLDPKLIKISDSFSVDFIKPCVRS